MTNKQKYKEFCKKEKKISIFSKDWWLDSVCGEENWDVILIEKGGDIIVSMPFYKKKRAIFNIITMPKLTQIMGPYMKYPKGQKYHKRLSWEKEMMNVIIEKLPKCDYFIQNFHYNITNWLSFYWKNYKQTTNYTYVIEDLSNLDEVFKSFSQAKRKDIKKAEKQVEIRYNLSAKDFYENHRMTLSRQNKKISYEFKFFEKIYKNSYKNNSATTIYAIDRNQNIHGALFIIWDENSAYNLISTIDPEFRNSGAASLLVKEAIKFISSKTKKFDFEGSMIENVEASFRNFGAIQKPYFTIFKTSSKLLKIRELFKEVIR